MRPLPHFGHAASDGADAPAATQGSPAQDPAAPPHTSPVDRPDTDTPPPSTGPPEESLVHEEGCAVCLGPLEAEGVETAFACGCAKKHWVHTGSCLDQLVTSGWRLDPNMVALSGTSETATDWAGLRGCPLCPEPLSPERITRELLPVLSPSVLRAALAVCVAESSRHVPPTAEAREGAGAVEGAAVIADELQELSILRCPSCRAPFELSPDRGCDAMWCSNDRCRRAFCIWCLTDCGDHAKTDASALADPLCIGDAHDHVKDNDCGLTGGSLFSGQAVSDYHQALYRGRVAMRLKRLDDSVRARVCGLLGHTADEVLTWRMPVLKIEPVVQEVSTAANDPEFVTRCQFITAAYSGSVADVRRHLEMGIDAEVGDAKHPHTTALHFAASKGHDAIVELLLAHGVDPFHTDAFGRTALHYAVNSDAAGNLSTVRLLARAMLAAPFKVDRVPWLLPMNGGATTLAYATQNGHPVAANYLQSLSGDGHALHLAACLGDLTAVITLLDSPHTAPAEDLVLSRDVKNGGVASIFVCKDSGVNEDGKVAVLKRLIEAGTDVHTREVGGNTSLITMSVEPKPSIKLAQLLIDHGGRRVLESTSVLSKTAEQHAREKGWTEFAAFLGGITADS